MNCSRQRQINKNVSQYIIPQVMLRKKAEVQARLLEVAIPVFTVPAFGLLSFWTTTLNK